GLDLSVAHDALDRFLPARVHRLPPPRFDVRDGEPRLRGGERVRQRRAELPRPAGVRLLPRRDGPPRHASQARDDEHAEDARPVASEAPAGREPTPDGDRRAHDRGEHVVPARRPLRSGAMSLTLDAHVPGGPIDQKWDNRKFEMKLVNPANKRKYHVIVVGTGLAGASAAASMAELGYNVTCFCYQDSPRRAHSIAAQGGINAGKNYRNDGDSVRRLFYDTIKGGDFRSREANVYRLAQVSVNIIDQCVAQGVPFA